MPITTTADERIGLTTHLCEGDIALQDVLDALDRFYRDPSLPDRVLWDFTGDVNLMLSSADVQQIAVYPARYAVDGRLKGGRRAILARSDLGFGLARMMDAHKENSPELTAYETRAFRERDEALRWLGE